MNFKHVLIVTYGRTGSTLLQGILNSNEKFLIHGENFNFCYGFFKTYSSIINLSEHIQKHEERPIKFTSPFFGGDSIDKDLFLEGVYNLIQKQLGIFEATEKGVCTGFKEIRYTPSALNIKEGKYELNEYLTFLEKLFPNVAFIFLTRNHSEVIKSGFWKGQSKESVLNQITTFESKSKNWSKDKSNCYWIDYKSLTKTSSALIRLFDFLGCDFDSESYEKVINTEYSYGNKKTVELEANSAYQVGWFDIDLLSDCFIDQFLTDSLLDANSKFFGGCIVLDKEYYQDGYTLELNSSSCAYIAEWFKPSPAMAKRYPENHNAIQSRFRFVDINLNKENEWQLYLKSNAGEKYLLAELKQQ